MSDIIEKRLNKFFFPVEERKIYFDTPGNPKATRDFKAIVRADNNKLISVVQDSYKLVSNYEVIMPLMEQLHNLDTRWNIDNSHTFVESNRMRLQVTFPDLTLNDGRSDIALSLYLHNSYDQSEGVRLFWGALRMVCLNGMVLGTLLSKYYRKHTAGFEISNLKDQLESTYDKVPVIKQRIEILQNLEVTDVIRKEVEDKMGKKLTRYLIEQEEQNRKAISQWALFNLITYYISHEVDLRMRAAYQLKASNIFKL